MNSINVTMDHIELKRSRTIFPSLKRTSHIKICHSTCKIEREIKMPQLVDGHSIQWMWCSGQHFITIITFHYSIIIWYYYKWIQLYWDWWNIPVLTRWIALSIGERFGQVGVDPVLQATERIRNGAGGFRRDGCCSPELRHSRSGRLRPDRTSGNVGRKGKNSASGRSRRYYISITHPHVSLDHQFDKEMLNLLYRDIGWWFRVGCGWYEPDELWLRPHRRVQSLPVPGRHFSLQCHSGGRSRKHRHRFFSFD